MKSGVPPAGMVALLTLLAAPLLAFGDVGALSRQALELSRQGKHLQAIEVAQRALAEAEATLGANHINTARGLKNVARVYYVMGRYDEALPWLQRALTTYEKALGRDHASTATTMNDLATLYKSMGRYDEALPLVRHALAFRENSLGPDHPDTAMSLRLLAELNQVLGRYDEALRLYRRALAIDERALGPEHVSTSTSLSKLAGLYLEIGRHDEALQLYRRALTIDEKVLGPDHEDTAGSLISLATMYKSMGRYDEALPLYRRALAIQEKWLGLDHPDISSNLSSIAQVYQVMGRYDEALPLFRRALAIWEKAHGPDHPYTATGLHNLAVLNWEWGRCDEALLLAQRALAISEKTRGPDHARTSTILSGIALIYQSMGRYDEALPLFRRALAIRESGLGPDHPYTATSLHNLARLYQAMGRYDEAMPLFRRGVRILALGEVSDTARDHGAIRELSVATANLATALAKSEQAGARDEAIFYYKLSVNARQRMRAGTRGLDEATRDSFTKQVEDAYQALADLLIERGRIGEAERVLLLLKEAELTQYLRRNGDDVAAGPQLLAWTSEEDAFRQELERVAARWREHGIAQRALAESIKQGRARIDGPEAMGLEQLRVQLDAQTRNVMDDAALRFVAASQAQYTQRLQALDSARTQLSTKLGELQRRAEDNPRTAGLMLLPGERGLTLIVTTDQGAVPLVRKVSEAELTGLVKRLREAVAAQGDYRIAAKALYEHLIAPAESQLDGAKDIQQWAILPFGALATVPYAALVRPDGTHLIERYALSVLTADGTGRLDGLDTLPLPTWRGVGLGASKADPDFGNVALPGVQREICGVVRGQGSEACRSGEGVIPGPRYIDREFTRQRLQFLLGASNVDAEVLHIATHFKLENSVLMTGDGKLSTRELLAWNPRFGAYDLIALSACDSGSGNTALESLGGLFRSKGAKAVLATLWPVADIGAAPLMVEFYRQRGETRRMGKAQALRQAQLAMLKGRLQDETGKADLRHPYFWAPYVLMGNWL